MWTTTSRGQLPKRSTVAPPPEKSLELMWSRYGLGRAPQPINGMPRLGISDFSSPRQGKLKKRGCHPQDRSNRRQSYPPDNRVLGLIKAPPPSVRGEGVIKPGTCVGGCVGA